MCARSPWDRNLVYSSVGKTGRLVIADAAWMSGGVAAEITALGGRGDLHALKAPIGRVRLPDAPAPTSAVRASVPYRLDDIVPAVEKCLCRVADRRYGLSHSPLSTRVVTTRSSSPRSIGRSSTVWPTAISSTGIS